MLRWPCICEPAGEGESTDQPFLTPAAKGQGDGQTRLGSCGKDEQRLEPLASKVPAGDGLEPSALRIWREVCSDESSGSWNGRSLTSP